MFYVYGERLYGSIDQCGTTHLATRFFHVWYLPLIPLKSVLVLFQGGDAYRFLPQPFSARSLLAALLRTWGVVFIVLPGLPLMVGALTGSHAHAVPVVLWFLCNIVAVAYAYTRLGKLSSAERAQRMVYGSFVGYPLDVARAGRSFPDLRRTLLDELRGLAQAQGLGGSRGSLTGPFDHVERAAETNMDLAYLRAALVLARLQWAEAKGPERLKRAAQHAAIWSKIERQQAAPEHEQERERRVPRREWVDLNPQSAVPAPAEEQESRVPEREWVDLQTEVDAPPLAAEQDKPQPGGRDMDASPPFAPSRTAVPQAMRRREPPHSAAKLASRQERSTGVIVSVIVTLVVLGLIGLGVLRGTHKRMFAHGSQAALEQEQGEREAKSEDVKRLEAKASQTAACQLNTPRSWKVAVKQEEDTPYKSLTLTNPSGDMSLYAVMRPLDATVASEEALANKAAALRADKNTLVESGWLDLPVHRVWREVRSLAAEEPDLTEVSYTIRKPASDIQVRARLPSLRFPQFRKFIEDIMQSVYCDEPGKAPLGAP